MISQPEEKKKIIKLNIIRRNRNDIDEKDSIKDIMSSKAPAGWRKVFEEAKDEAILLDELLPPEELFFPLRKNLFRAFDWCSLKNVKLVIVGQDPYYTIGNNGLPNACGASFVVEVGEDVPPSLVNIYKELQREYPDFEMPNHGWLLSWAEQGVLFLNKCLTVKPHKPGSHNKIWDGVLRVIIDAITVENSEAIYMGWGSLPIELSSIVSSKSPFLKATHPSPKSWKKEGGKYPPFWGCDHFKKANELLIKQGRSPINWNLPMWDGREFKFKKKVIQ